MENEQEYVVINRIKWRVAIKCYPLTDNYFFRIQINCNSTELSGANSIQLGFRGKSHLTQNRLWE